MAIETTPTDIRAVTYRFEDFDLVAGNKTSGFTAAIPTATLVALAKCVPSRAGVERLRQMVHERLARSGLISKKQIERTGVALFEGSACPRIFALDPVFSSSLSVDYPELLPRLLQPELCARIGDDMFFTPHNVDNPKQAVALSIIVITWAEWATIELALFKSPSFARSSEGVAA